MNVENYGSTDTVQTNARVAEIRVIHSSNPHRREL
jgi:hypothetical protein